MQKGGRHDALDGLRAVCIVFTLINHTPHNPGINGNVGVDVFFALSGYLITMLLMQERAKTGRNCLKGFYVRRAFRILPMYLLTIGLYLAAALAAGRMAEFKAVFPWVI